MNDDLKKKKNRDKQRKYLDSHPEARANKRQYTTYWRIRRKKDLIEYKGGKCEICGYNKDIPGAYDFHHRNPLEKEFDISRWRCLNYDKLLKEVDKCMLVCRNCHAELHDNRELREESSLLKRVMKEEINIICPCGITVKTKNKNRKYCSEKCARIANRKVNRPSKEDLINDMGYMNREEIGRKYGVSGSAIKKWQRIYELI